MDTPFPRERFDGRPSEMARPDAMESELAAWIERIDQVDEILRDPALSLITIANHFLRGAGCGTYKDDRGSVLRMLPVWIGDGYRQSSNPSVLVHALCCSTLQRLSRVSRRFSWLDSEALRRLEAELPKTLLREHLQQSKPDYMFVLADDVFGTLNPFTSAEVFRVFLNAGEEWAHRASGFLSAFGTLWMISAGASGADGFGARDRPLAASVVARCLIPLKQLETTIVTRSGLYRRIASLCVTLENDSTSTNPHRRWKYAYGLDELCGLMTEMAKVAIDGPSFEGAANAISGIAGAIRPRDFDARWSDVLTHVRNAVANVGKRNKSILAEARTVLTMLRGVDFNDPVTRLKYKIELRPRIRNEETAQYWTDMTAAAKAALDTCDQAVERLEEAAQYCEQLDTTPGDARSLRRALQKLADLNDQVADLVRNAVAPTLAWCRQVVRQEVAYASAGNDAEFDAADLLSAISVVERWDQISDLEVADALKKAMRGAREDGSWATGQPMYVRNRLLGVWPGSADMAWLLSTAATGKKALRVADDALLRFADWLGRTTTHLEYRYDADDEVVAAGPQPSQRLKKPMRVPLAGWSAEMREMRNIDLWTTAGAINALLDTRDLIEHRLWELCRRRFFVVGNVNSLDAVDPVDLGARHERRVHHILRQAARQSRGNDWKRAEYSFVLHGPPGSSKTAIAEALGREMAAGPEPRVIRVTPADFTRQGEARVDSEARFIFDLLTHIRGATIIFDEIDDLLRRRALKGDPLFLKMIIPAMLNRLQDLRNAAPRQETCFIVAMNYVDNVEPALVRPGRIDRAIAVVYPDPWGRENTLERVIEKFDASKRIEPRLRTRIVNATAAWPWPTFHRLCLDLATGASVDSALIDRKLEQYATEFQDAAASYVAPERWSPHCPPLVDEVAQFVLTYSRREDECSAAIEQQIFRRTGTERAWRERIVRKDSVIDDVRKRFTTIWRTVHERTDYSKRGAMSSREMGATLADDKKTVAFRVWAPDVTGAGVEIEGHERPYELAEEENGLWSGDVPDLREGIRYRYLIGSAAEAKPLPRNDPYSREVVDTENGPFTVLRSPRNETAHDVAGWHDLVIYQIDPHTCETAELRTWEGISNARLQHLHDMGVNAIDLVMPAEQPVSAPATYKPADVRKLEEDYGGIKALRRLVSRAHSYDIAVIAGVTTRHLLGRGIVDLKQFTGVTDDDRGPYFTDVTACGPRPAFDRKQVRDLICENARRWIAEIGVDGLRWEGVHLVRNQTGSTDEELTLREGIGVMQAVNEVARRVPLATNPNQMRRTITIAQDVRELSSTVGRGPQDAHFGAQWSNLFAQFLRRAIRDPDTNLSLLAESIARRYVADAFTRVIFVESRDTWRKRFAASVREKERRANAPRASDEEVERKVILAAGVLVATPGIPMLLQGQELASEEREVDWSLAESRRHVLEAHRQMFLLRRNWWGFTEGLRGHHVWVTHQAAPPVLTVHRWNQGRAGQPEGGAGDDVVIVLNFGGEPLRDFSAVVPHGGAWIVHFNSDPAVGTPQNARIEPELADKTHRVRLSLGAYGVAILSQRS